MSICSTSKYQRRKYVSSDGTNMNSEEEASRYEALVDL
jgi:hypothetical protein